MQNNLANFIRATGFFLLVAACQPTNDTKIQQSVQSGVNILGSAIQVRVSDGVVTLSGTVKDSVTRSTAETSVKEINGVKSVINKIAVE